jgi:hypothetical protein
MLDYARQCREEGFREVNSEDAWSSYEVLALKDCNPCTLRGCVLPTISVALIGLSPIDTILVVSQMI